MMADQFSVLLRRHLVEAANERPADGQLDAVLQATSGAGQRRSWLIRARWLLDPAAPFANARIRYGAAALALLIAAAMVAIVVGSGGLGGFTAFEGRWRATDPTDRSTETLVIDGGRSPDVHLEDDFSIDCQRRGDTTTNYVATGRGEVAGSRLVVRYATAGCEEPLAAYEVVYAYDAATDTLLDDHGISWDRAP